jgi:hypothetical protein
MKKPEVTKFDQKIIDAYEQFIIDVYDACSFVKMGCGKPHEGVFDVLIPLINQEEKKMWGKIKKEVSK